MTCKLSPIAAGPHTELTARAKFPTGDDDRGLGTGEMDYDGQVDLDHHVARTTPFLNVGHRVHGDGRNQLQDGFHASGGLTARVTDDTSVGAALDWRERTEAGGDDALETTAFVYRRLNHMWSAIVDAQSGAGMASAGCGPGFVLPRLLIRVRGRGPVPRRTDRPAPTAGTAAGLSRGGADRLIRAICNPI